MRLLVAAITFGVTVGGLFLVDNYKTQPKEENYAQIVQELANQTQIKIPTIKTPTPKPTNKSSKITIKTLVPSPTPSFVATPIPTLPSASPTPLPTLTFTPIFTPTVTLTPTPSPTAIATPTESNQPTATPTTGHIYYTSSYATAKYYYCNTDDGWKTLSTKYLKSFSSPEELLKAYPTRILHEPCKN